MASWMGFTPRSTSLSVTGTSGAPRWTLMFGVVRLASITMTSFPNAENAVPRLMAVVVFPTPPFPETTPMIFVIANPPVLFLACSSVALVELQLEFDMVEHLLEVPLALTADVLLDERDERLHSLIISCYRVDGDLDDLSLELGDHGDVPAELLPAVEVRAEDLPHPEVMVEEPVQGGVGTEFPPEDCGAQARALRDVLHSSLLLHELQE